MQECYYSFDDGVCVCVCVCVCVTSTGTVNAYIYLGSRFKNPNTGIVTINVE